MSLLRRALASLLATIAVVGASAAARAEPLTPDETARLWRGETVSRLETVENDAHRYVGGVTYTLVGANVSELEGLLDDVHAYTKLLPMTKDARKVGADHGDLLVWLRQGNSIAEASYTIRIHKDPKTSTVRFWLDPTRPHGISDAWGFFRAEPVGDGARVLLTYGVLVDIGDGIGRALFEERVRRVMLSVPERVVRYLADTHARLAQSKLPF